MPAWIQILQGLLTPAIAIGVFWVAFQQWRTARAKLNLDLFSKRYEVYEHAHQALILVMTHGGVNGTEAFRKMFEAWRESQFLFGVEVSTRLDEFLMLIMQVQAAEAEMEDATADRQATAKKKWDGVKRLSEERTRLIDLFKPYMLMNDRRIGTFGEWIEERNRLRLSHADEKQR